MKSNQIKELHQGFETAFINNLRGLLEQGADRALLISATGA